MATHHPTTRQALKTWIRDRQEVLVIAAIVVIGYIVALIPSVSYYLHRRY